MNNNSHFEDLERLLGDSLEKIGGSIPTTTVDSVLPRSNDSSIFTEGEEFGPLVKIGLAESCITMPASPHVYPDIDIEEFRKAKKEVLANDRLPNFNDEVDLLSPHLVVWWRNRKDPDSMKFDFVDIFKLGPDIVQDFSKAIALSVSRGTAILDKVNNRPAIGGSWGNASNFERQSTGLSRGLPTIGLGHLHLQNLRDNPNSIDFEEVASVKETIDNLSPWNRILLEKLGEPGRRILENEFNTILEPTGLHCEIRRDNRYEQLNTDVTTQEEGYEVKFSSELNIEVVFNLLINIAGKFENFYYSLSEEYPNLYKFDRDSNDYISSLSRIRNASTQFGLIDTETSDLIDFVQLIKPTYTQLLSWKDELLEQDIQNESIRRQVQSLDKILIKYKRHNQFVNLHKKPQNHREAIVFDTYKSPENSEQIGFTWPVHFSACYLISDYILGKDQISLKKFRIFPGIASTTSIRRTLGTILRRSSMVNKK